MTSCNYRFIKRDLYYKKDKRKGTECNINDVFDGNLYKNHFNGCHYIGSEQREKSKELDISLQLNTDGVSIFRSSSYSEWPLYLLINELHPKQRFSCQYKTFAGLWFGEGKPLLMNIFLLPLIEELSVLYHKDVNECDVGICQNGAACTNSDGGFNCTCIGDWTGSTCAELITTSFNLTFETVQLDLTSALLDPTSPEFQNVSSRFCNDLNSTTSGTVNNLVGCKIVEFRTNPAEMEVIIVYAGNQSATTGDKVQELLFDSKMKKRFGDVIGIEVGDLVVKFSDVVLTAISFEKQLLNFTYDPLLANPNSSLSQSYETAFCNEIQTIVDANPMGYPTYEGCVVNGYGPDSFNFSLKFESNVNATDIQASFDAAIASNYTKERFDRFEGYRLGNFFISLGTIFFSEVPLTYSLLQPSWTSGLADSTSRVFRQTRNSFCNNLVSLLSDNGFPAIDSCEVEEFRQGDFVDMDFVLEFSQEVILTDTQRDISNTVFQQVPRIRVGRNIGNSIGSTVVYYASSLFYSSLMFDGWASNLKMVEFASFFSNDYNNRQSTQFTDFERDLCTNGLNITYRELRFFPSPERFIGCYIQGFSDKSDEPLDRLEVSFSLLFNGTEPVVGLEVWSAILANSTEFQFAFGQNTITYQQIGGRILRRTEQTQDTVFVRDLMGQRG